MHVYTEFSLIQFNGSYSKVNVPKSGIEKTRFLKKSMRGKRPEKYTTQKTS